MARQRTNSDFERLVQEHHGDVWLSARRVLRSDDDARDVTQEVFLRVLDGRLRVDEESDSRRVLCWWSIRIALNTQRGARRRREREDQHAMEQERTSEESGEARRLWGFVEELPDDLRVPVVLRFAQGFGFADIGEAVGVAESTAYERVQRGLARLRESLKRAGFAILAVDLESNIGSAAPGQAPVGLARTLLELPASSAATTGALGSTAVAALLATGVVAIGASIHAFVGGDRSEQGPSGNDLVVAAVAEDDGPGGLSAPGAASTPSADRVAIDVAPELEPIDDQEGTADVFGDVRGRVVDADGGPLAGCEVSIFSVERSGKQHAYCAKARTDVNGRFRTSVQLADEDGGHYRVQAVRHGYAIQRSGSMHVRPEAETDFGDVVAAPGAGLADGSFTLDLEVVGPDGRPVQGVGLILASAVDLPVLAGTNWSEWLNVGDRLERAEGRTVTDTAGLARLEGRMLGGKSLRVVPPDETLAPQLVRFDMARGATKGLLIALEPARSIAGRIRVVDEVMTPEIAKALQAHIVGPTTGGWKFAEIESDGSFRFDGLPSGTHRVHASIQNWSGGAPIGLAPGWLDIDAGTEDVDLALKRETDTRDIGVHGAELHGRIVRAEDGAPHTVSWWSVDVVPVDLPAGADVERDWFPNHIFPRPVQRAAMGPTPDDASEFHRTGVQAGNVLLRCESRDRAMFAHGPIELGEREIVSDLVLELQPAGSISGVVEGPDGEAVDGAYVFATGVGPISDGFVTTAERAYREADGRGFFFVNGTGGRAKDGRFELDSLPPGVTFRLAAVHPKRGRALGKLITLEPGESLTDVRIRY